MAPQTTVQEAITMPSRSASPTQAAPSYDAGAPVFGTPLPAGPIWPRLLLALSRENRMRFAEARAEAMEEGQA